MPTRGYRKGVSDDKLSSPRRIHTRLPDDVHAALFADADNRCTPASSIIRALLTAHYRHERAELPHPRGLTHAAVRALDRLGNNINQIARQANLMRLTQLEREAHAVVAAALQSINTLMS